MSSEAVRDDLFSILQKFLTPTMAGQFPNTNAPRPMPPAGSDAARQMSDPSRYPSGGGPAPEPPADGPPVPVGRRVVPDPETTGSTGRGGGGGGPRAVSGAPVVSSPDGSVPMPAIGASTAPDFLNAPENDYYRAYVAQMNKRRAQELRDRALGDIAGGIMGLGGALTGTPMEGVETTGKGNRGALPSADLTLDQFGQLRKNVEDARLLKEHRARVTEFSKRYGIPENDLLLLKQDDLSKLSFNKYDDKSVADALKAMIDARKAEQGLADPAKLNHPETIKMIARMQGRDPNDPNVLRQIEAMPADEKVKLLGGLTTPGGAGGGGFGEAYQKRILEAAEAGRKAGDSVRNAQEQLAALQNDEGWTGIIGGSGYAQTLAKIGAQLGIPGLKENATESEVLQYRSLLEHAARAKLFTGDLNKEEQRILTQLAGGDISQTRDALIYINKKILAKNVLEMVKARDTMETGKRDFSATPFAAQGIGSLEVPDYTASIFSKGEIDDIRTASQRGLQGDKQYEGAVRAAVDRTYGPGMYDYAVRSIAGQR
jgi:hypothetical protein